jgi:hypothetical protein
MNHHRTKNTTTPPATSQPEASTPQFSTNGAHSHSEYGRPIKTLVNLPPVQRHYANDDAMQRLPFVMPHLSGIDQRQQASASLSPVRHRIVYQRLAPTRERAALVLFRQTGSNPPDESLAITIIRHLAVGVEPLAQFRVVEPPWQRDTGRAQSGPTGRLAERDDVPVALDTIELADIIQDSVPL